MQVGGCKYNCGDGVSEELRHDATDSERLARNQFACCVNFTGILPIALVD